MLDSENDSSDELVSKGVGRYSDDSMKMNKGREGESKGEELKGEELKGEELKGEDMTKEGEDVKDNANHKNAKTGGNIKDANHTKPIGNVKDANNTKPIGNVKDANHTKRTGSVKEDANHTKPIGSVKEDANHTKPIEDIKNTTKGVTDDSKNSEYRSKNTDIKAPPLISSQPPRVPLSTLMILERRPVQETPATKITVRFQPIGSTPALNPRIFKISAEQTVLTLVRFVNKRLRNQGPLHLYVQNLFLPTPDEVLGDLYKLFKTSDELVIGYCYLVAFG